MKLQNLQQESGLSDSRKEYIDLLRIIACFAVIVIHIASENLYDLDFSSKEWMILNFYNGITRFCVPVFFMISGALFLGGRERSIKEMFTKYIFRTLAIYLLWSMLYAVFDVIVIDKANTDILKQIIKMFIISKYHLWFLPTLIGLYIVTPLLYKIVNNNKDLSRYFLCIYFLFTLLIPFLLSFTELPYFSYIKTILQKISPEVVGTYCGYYVLGYYLHKYLNISKIIASGIFAISILITVLSIMRGAAASAESGTIITYYWYGSLPTFLMSFSIFMLCKTFYRNKNTDNNQKFIVNRKWLSTTSEFTLGIYLIHPLFRSIFEDILGINNVSFNPLYFVPVLSLVVFVCSFASIAILRKIPVINRFDMGKGSRSIGSQGEI